MTRIPLFALLCALAASAANIPITVLGSTQTQIVIRYAAPSASACAVSAVNNDSSINVHDLDPAKFTGANLDLSRTTANGFRWPTLVNGGRTVTIGGHDEIKKGADGKWYSTALQAYSDHTITVTCGSDTGTVHASTDNIIPGSNYPELPIPQPGAPLGGIPQPTVDWADPTFQVTDPITGLLMFPLSSPLDVPGSSLSGFFLTGYDAGSAWTNPQYGATNQASGTLAVTTTANAGLFLPWGALASKDYADLQVSLYGYSADGATASVCITEDSGQSCASDIIDVPFTGSSPQVQALIPNATLHAPNAPYAFPKAYFAGWGVWNKAYGPYDLTNLSYASVSASDTTVTNAAQTSAASAFNVDRPAGTMFSLSGCTGAPAYPLHMAAVPTTYTITSVESGLSLSGCAFQELAAGIKIWLKNTGTLHVSATYVLANGSSDGYGTDGSHYECAPSKVTDISKDTDGIVQSPPVSGRLCQLYGSSKIYLMQDNGKHGLQMNGWATAAQGGGSVRQINNVTDPWIDAKTLILQDNNSSQGAWTATLNNSGDYTTFTPDVNHVSADKFTYSHTETIQNPRTKATSTVPAGSTSALQYAMATGMWTSGLNIATTSGGYITYSMFGPGGVDLPCFWAAYDSSWNLLSTWNSWEKYPARWGACHASPIQVNHYGWLNFGNADAMFSSTYPLSGPFISAVSAVAKNGIFTSYRVTATAATNASPVVLTVPTNDLAGYTNVSRRVGAYLVCSGGTGSWAALNRPVYATKPVSTSLALYADAKLSQPIDSTTFGALTGTITCSAAPQIYSVPVSAVAAADSYYADGKSHARVTVNKSDAAYQQKFPSGALVVQDADPINFQNLSQTMQYWAKSTCPSCTASQFDVYRDAALTQPAPVAEITAAVNGTVALSEMCPDPATITLPGKIYFDSGFGTPGQPKNRCLKFRLTAEPCSSWASATEAAAYPCPTDPTKSSLQNLAVGDNLFQVDQGWGNGAPGEYFFILKKDGLDVTVMRWWRDLSNDPRNANYYLWNHPAGGLVFPRPAATMGYFDFIENKWYPEDPNVGGAHHDQRIGTQTNQIVISAPSIGVNDVLDQPMAALESVPITHSDELMWSNYGAVMNTHQNYPSNRKICSEIDSLSGLPCYSKLDWYSANGSQWFAPNTTYGIFPIAAAPALVPGTKYVYKLRSQNSLIGCDAVATVANCVKQFPVLTNVGPHTYFVDKSGPGSQITDADLGKKCVPYAAGECVAGSALGDVYVAMTGLYTGQTYCSVNTATMSNPCPILPSPGLGWAVETMQQPINFAGQQTRRMTLGFGLPMSHFTSGNWVSSPDGKWAFLIPQPTGARPMWDTVTSRRWWAAKMPPWPAPDGVNRTALVPYTVRLSGRAGDKIRATWWYGENGNPGDKNCTGRGESCWTSATATATNPYVFASETQSTLSCDTGCTLSIPLIPGRVAYYQIERSNGSSVALLPVQVAVAP